MSISGLAIRRPVFTWMLMFALIFFGWLSFKRMGVSMMPDIDFPIVNVRLSFEGAAPEVMESDVVDPVEASLMGVQGVTNITSSVKTGRANVSVEFELSKDINLAVQEIQNKLMETRRLLPRNIDEPVVSKVNPEDQPIIWLSVSSPTWKPSDLMAYTRDNITDQFQTVDGVGEVTMGGFIDPNLRVWLHADKLNRYALTADDVVAAILNEHAELPSGRIETPEKEFNIRTMGEASSVAEFGRIAINRRGGSPNYQPIQIKDVADVEEGLADIRGKTMVKGNPAVGIGVRKQRGANAVEVAQGVKAKLEVIKKGLPSGLELNVRFDSTRFIEESINELLFTLLLSAFLTAMVCWAFLGSWSATINIILAIPTSVLGSFIVLQALGFTLNTFTVLGLSLAIGVVVDDAIMVLENIVRHLEKKRPPGVDAIRHRVQSALNGANEITFAAIATSASVMAIFLPVAYMKGIIGKFFFQFGVTISVAVALSLLEALTLTPMRTSQFLSVSKKRNRFGTAVEDSFLWLAAKYRRALPVVLKHRWKTLGLALLFFAGTFGTAALLKKEFSPAQDQGLLFVRMKGPEGSAMEYTDTRARQVENLLTARGEVEGVFTIVGGFGGGDVNTAMFMVNLKDVKKRPIDPEKRKRLTQQQFADSVRPSLMKIQGAKVFIQDMSQAGFSSKRGFPIEFTIQGPDWDKLVELSKKMLAAMEASKHMTDIDSDYVGGALEVQILPDRDKALLHGVSVTDIGRTVNALVGGTIVARYPKGSHRFDIRVRLVPGDRRNAEDLKRLFVRNNRGELIRLTDIVRIVENPGAQIISRQGRERAISLFANMAPKISQNEALATVQRLGKEILPDGYRIVESGSSKTYRESFQSLLFALLLGILVAYMILASQFNSFIHPLTVLVALPFSVSGAFVALLIGGQSLNIYSMIGLVLLMGLVKKNSILLVDFTNQMRETGLGVREALIEACPIRLRPIIMTSVSTIAGAIPPALALGPGAETRIPMATAVIGGMIVSTVLTLFVVPVVYSLFSRLQRGEGAVTSAQHRKPVE